jgi:GntR family transcriptional regulator, transcriptional repressor for pyruvate dehydrogenase complex
VSTPLNSRPSAPAGAPSLETIFAPVRSQTAFEETLERLGTAIKLGLLEPGSRLPAERELCGRLGIARSTLRQALTALVQSGHLRAVRGRGGGTFVAESPPPKPDPSKELLAGWRDACDARLAVELGVAVLACERAAPADLPPLRDLIEAMDAQINDFPAYRQSDVHFHIGLAQATRSSRLVASATEVQGAMTDLISYIPHPPEVLTWSNAQHATLLHAVGAGDAGRAVSTMIDHLSGTEHVLAGLLPGD